MDIIDVRENEDGSAVLEIDMTQEEMRLLMEAGLNKVLADYIEEMKHVPIPNRDSDIEQEKGSDK